MLNLLKPKKFLCHYPLYFGAYAMGIVMCCISGICSIVLLVHLSKDKTPSMTKSSNGTASENLVDISYNLWMNIYAVTVVAFLDCVIMTIVNCWFLWGVKKQKSQIIVVWLALTALWLAHEFVFVTVVIIRHISSSRHVLGWSISLILVTIIFGVFSYGFLCSYCYWLELRRLKYNKSTKKIIISTDV